MKFSLNFATKGAGYTGPMKIVMAEFCGIIVEGNGYYFENVSKRTFIVRSCVRCVLNGIAIKFCVRVNSIIA